jgi:hypothetical protein
MLKLQPIQKTEFGDFQTPTELAQKVCRLLAQQGLNPISILEPTCGQGGLLIAALDQFPTSQKAIGVDLNTRYINDLKQKLSTRSDAEKVQVFQGDFFEFAWKPILSELPEPTLIIGNPPWVTNSALGTLASKNIPKKNNFQNYSGLDAITGKSNFDISEWMLIHLLELANGRDATLAMLCKTSVARKALQYAWQRNVSLDHARIYLINAKKYFGVSVDTCLLVCTLTRAANNPYVCEVYQDTDHGAYLTTFGLEDGRLIANVHSYHKLKHLEGGEIYKWRSGLKHDCAKVMELVKHGRGYKNGLGEVYDLENDYIYPLLKSSDLVKTNVSNPSRYVLVTQTYMGENTTAINNRAPKTWAYLTKHRSLFDQRKSSIYKDKPPFSIFGIGDYSFASWKVAISGLYKNLHFVVVGPEQDKPVMLDDTCYFIPCHSEQEAVFLVDLLNSAVAQEFFRAYIFWDAKRPITAAILNRLNLAALAQELGLEAELRQYLPEDKVSSGQVSQLWLFS